MERIPEEGRQDRYSGRGTIAEVKDTFLLVEVDNNVKLRVDKTSVVKDITDAQNK